MTPLTLARADALADSTLRQARSVNAAPLTVVVLDAGGHAVVVKREDGSGILRVEIATAKAYGALGMGFSSREIGDRADAQPVFFGAVATVAGGRLAPAAGGLLIRDPDGHVIGAIGVSGDTSDVDEACAAAALSDSPGL
ncbi:heme-binding protein [Actinoplanes bogorensis]|uniref:Heme-binding protein n=1 Tax=Paractinoplanes bogorensis TaxID=1610840 RepID=A0ABS5YLY5_9ACTN|nr:heme-binding protein [Actinoplanes bogorensis]MBU2664056.1 heme-binding protein [Actinoplanes bogorensis]